MLVFASVATLPGRARAAFVLTLTQSGGNVVLSGSGTLNTTSLISQGAAAGPFSFTSYPSNGYALVGSGTPLIYAGLSGPATFGLGTGSVASSTTGGIVGVNGGNGRLYVPIGYTSGTALASTATVNGATIDSLGFGAGTFVYSWGTGVNADTFTVFVPVVPEPSTWALLGLGAAALGLTLRRCRRAVH